MEAAWAQAGHLVGNHTASHRSLADPKVSLEWFIADVQAADATVRDLPSFVPMLRFPYLKEGDTLTKRDGLRAWMARNGYKSAPISIDASDWYYISANTAFQDPLYAQAPDTLPAGESIIWAHAKARNLPGLRYPAEDSVYEEPLLRDAGLVP